MILLAFIVIAVIVFAILFTRLEKKNINRHKKNIEYKKKVAIQKEQKNGKTDRK